MFIGFVVYAPMGILFAVYGVYCFFAGRKTSEILGEYQGFRSK